MLGRLVRLSVRYGPQMQPEDFGLELILAEASRETAGDQANEELIVIERQGFTTADAFHVHEPGITLPMEGPGTLRSLVIVAQADTFNVDLYVDGQTVISESVSNLITDADEMPDISAYQRSDGDYVFSATDYQFASAVDAVIEPTASTTFERQRAEVDTIRD